MMSLGSIIAANEAIAAEAAKAKREPFVPNGPDDIDAWPTFPFPSIGSYEPPGWETTEPGWFVDATGHGRRNEIALTVEQFREELRRHIEEHPAHGFAITEEGPFQVVIHALRESGSEAL